MPHVTFPRKTTLLKCLAHLNLYHGTIEFKGKCVVFSLISSSRCPLTYLMIQQATKKLWYAHHPERHKVSFHNRRDTGVPSYRTHVQYIPQRPSLLPGTPRDLIETLCTFHSRLAPERFAGDSLHLHRAMDLAERWGIARELWDRPWGSLSGGEAQRLSLAIPYGLNCAEVLLLDGALPPQKLQRAYDEAYIDRTDVRARSCELRRGGEGARRGGQEHHVYSQGNRLGHPFRRAGRARRHAFSAPHSHWNSGGEHRGTVSRKAGAGQSRVFSVSWL
jgi:ABC-type iron transport system FetAB ATPase subunit